MTKTTPADGDSAEGAKRKKPSRTKTGAKKATSDKKPAAKKRPARKSKQVAPSEPEIVAAEPEGVEPAPIEDAEILAETPLAAGDEDTDVSPTVEAGRVLTDEEQELSAIYGDEAGAPATA